LYHQIAEAISYRIATGRLSAGEALPPVREAATQLGVNMHTVRRAYGQLASQGLVECRGARGTRVCGRSIANRRTSGTARTEQFLTRVLREAHELHGLAPHELAGLIANWSPAGGNSPDVAYVIECSELQCRDHISEIEAQWKVEGRPWTLSEDGEPPAGSCVATYFHYNEIRLRWPHRLHEIRFVAILPDPSLASSVGSPGKSRRVSLELCEFDEPKARNIAADLSVLFPEDRYLIEPHVVRRAGERLTAGHRRVPVLFTPRVWAALSAEEQAHPKAIKVRYVFPPAELESLGQHFGWRRRRA
jgi:GntR family transcriptional regulator